MVDFCLYKNINENIKIKGNYKCIYTLKNIFILFISCYSFNLPTEVTVVPLDGDICSNLGSIKGVKEDEDLCFCSVLLAD